LQTAWLYPVYPIAKIKIAATVLISTTQLRVSQRLCRFKGIYGMADGKRHNVINAVKPIQIKTCFLAGNNIQQRIFSPELSAYN